MPKALSIYLLVEAAVLVLAVLTLFFWDKRYGKNHGPDIPAGFEKTEEVTIDPKSGKKLRIYYNRTTGARFYHEEK